MLQRAIMHRQYRWILITLRVTIVKGCLNDSDNDGVCNQFEVLGCTDITVSWNPLATDDDGSCTYPALGYDDNGDCSFDADGDGTCDEDDGCPFDPNKTDRAYLDASRDTDNDGLRLRGGL